MDQMNDPLKKYRRQFRNWRNYRRLEQERLDYEKRFAAAGLSIPDDQDISNIISRRFPHIMPKPKGNLNILAVYHHYNWENYSLLPALEKFGRIRHYDWFDEFDHQKEKDWHKNIRARMNAKLIQKLKAWIEEEKAGVIFTYLTGALVTPEPMERIRDFGIPVINISLNDKENFVGKVRGANITGMRDICRYFDLSWTSTEDALKKYCVEGATPIYLPEGANPDIHKPWDVEKDIDVSFVGQKYGNRADVIARLQQEGIRVEAFGHGWTRGHLSTGEMVRLYSRSRINLGFGGVSGHADTYCLKGRDFEVPMSGGLYLTEYHPELERVYNLDREIMVYRNFGELRDKIRFLLANPKEAAEIRQQGYKRARREHTWERRFEKVFHLMGLIE